jgi:hypothetical protein
MINEDGIMVMDWLRSKVSIARKLALAMGLVVILCDPGHAGGPDGNDQPAERPLVMRGRIELTLAGAREVVAGAEAKAKALGIKEKIAIADAGRTSPRNPLRQGENCCTSRAECRFLESGFRSW